MTKESAGLSFQEAAAQALAEQDVTASESSEPVSSQPEPAALSEVEQPAVENVVEEEGLFSVLQDDGAESEQPEVDLDSLTVEVNGDVVPFPELQKGYMRQEDYTQKTQQVAETRKEYEKAIDFYEWFAQDPLANVQTLYNRLRTNNGQIPNDLGGKQAAASADEPDIDTLVEQRVQERLASDPRIQAAEQQDALKQVNARLDEIEKAHNVTLNTSDREAIMREAVRSGTPDLNVVFGNLMYQKSLREAEAKNVKAVSTASGRRSDPLDARVEEPEKYSSFRDAWAAAEREEESLQLLGAS